ncbi:MAG TPA: HDIG domain-containing protein [Tenuifilaceae bacterium]|nr:HDIG domain-containing protein [Tenuifilaceae bacterium]
MKKIYRFLKLHFQDIIRGLLFLVAIVAILVFLPRERKFKYEFQKGKAWMHEDLIAPFDFPIYKTDGEIIAERNAILSNVKPIFRLDSAVLIRVLPRFKSEVSDLFENQNKERKNTAQIPEPIMAELQRQLSFVYKKGIISNGEYSDIAGKQTNSISILTGNRAFETPLSELFSTGSAIDYLQTKTAIIVSKYPRSGSFVKSIDWGNYVLANLHFDAKSTEIITQDMLANLSITKGLVYAGESIVTKGEVINQDLYQIIFSLKREYESKIGFRGSFRVLILGQALLISMLFLMLFLFLYNFRREILSDNRKIIFILLLITIMAILSSILIKRNIINIYIIPLAIVPIFIRTFYDSRLALFIHLVTVFLVGFFVPNSFEFVFIHFIAGIIAIISLTNLYRRGKLFLSISLVYISYIAVYVGIAIIQEGSILTIDPYSFLWFAINALLLLTSYQLIYLFEKIFGFLSDTTLMELSDTNQDLLRQLAEKAPGTFQHSLQVANLAEEAIFKIGGNPLLARAGALYHDIGKMNNPYYFIENQASGFNPHQGIDYEESAGIIIKHVAEGIQIAKKHNIPEQIIDFIRTHHGTNKVQYFLRLYREKYPELKDNVSLFSYKGPKPFSRETAVLMMADAVEAASRALKTITYEAINDLVENIINYQQIEEQYSDADITFKDITVVKSAFKKKLVNIYHARIEYPKAMPM